MHLTPAMVEAAYELLRTTPPFRGWNLPHSDDVEFHATAMRDRFGDFHFWYDDKGKKPRGKWKIRIGQNSCSTLVTLMPLVAHEMCHFREVVLGTRPDVEHSSTFKKLADQVCRYHHFDRKAF